MKSQWPEKSVKANWVHDKVLDWFHSRRWVPFEFQREAWNAYLHGRSGLIHASTGTGKTHAFQDLTKQQFGWILDFVSNGGPPSRPYPDYKKITLKNGRYAAANKNIATRHRLNIGTITADASILVKFINGGSLGSVEERFVSKLKRGDVFVFAGRVLEYVRIRDMTLWVPKSRKPKGPVPQWMGGRMPLSTELASGVRDMLDRAARGIFDYPEMKSLYPILELQARWSRIPGRDDLLIEKWESRDGHHLYVYPFEGHLVNEGLGALLAYRLSRQTPLTISMDEVIEL